LTLNPVEAGLPAMRPAQTPQNPDKNKPAHWPVYLFLPSPQAAFAACACLTTAANRFNPSFCRAWVKARWRLIKQSICCSCIDLPAMASCEAIYPYCQTFRLQNQKHYLHYLYTKA
jgi:hypothetical protein